MKFIEMYLKLYGHRWELMAGGIYPKLFGLRGKYYRLLHFVTTKQLGKVILFQLSVLCIIFLEDYFFRVELHVLPNVRKDRETHDF